MNDIGRAERTPYVIRFVLAIEQGPEKVIKAGNMVHVEMGQEKMIYRQYLRIRNGLQAPITAIEKQATYRLAGVNAHQQRVVTTGRTQYFK